jgi:hypothetical protein
LQPGIMSGTLQYLCLTSPRHSHGDLRSQRQQA